MTEISVFDERLAEIDRRLRTIQADLAPIPDPSSDDAPEPAPGAGAGGPADTAFRVTAAGDRDRAGSEPPPAARLRAAPDPGPSDPTTPLIAQLHELHAANERLLELHRELLSQYAELLERRAAADAVAATLTAGPFPHAEALRGFERALGTLPGVCGVTVREYLSGDRVAIDVRLSSR